MIFVIVCFEDLRQGWRKDWGLNELRLAYPFAA